MSPMVKLKLPQTVAIHTLYFFDRTEEKKLSCMKYDGSGWSYVGEPGFSGQPVFRPYMILNDDEIYVSYLDGSRDFKISVQKFDGANWDPIETTGLDDIRAQDIHLAMIQDTLYCAYQAYHENSVFVKKFNGTEWKDLPNTSFYSSSSGNSTVELKVYQNKPALLYYNSSPDYEVQLLVYENNMWSKLGDFTMDYTDNYTMEVDDDILYMAFEDHNSDLVTAIKYENNQWDTLGTTAFNNRSFLDLSWTISNHIPYLLIGETVSYETYPTIWEFNGVNWELHTDFGHVSTRDLTLGSTNDQLFTFWYTEPEPYADDRTIAHKTSTTLGGISSFTNTNVNQPKVYSSGGYLHVEQEGSYTMEVYNTIGSEIYSGNCSGDMSVKLSSKGVFIANINGQTYRIVNH